MTNFLSRARTAAQRFLRKVALKFHWYRYDRISRDISRAYDKKDAIAARIDRIEARMWAEEAWLTKQK